MEPQDKGRLRAWPEWLAQFGPGMDILLEAIDRHREELQRYCASSHVYRRLGQAQLQEFDALAEKQGLYGPSKQLQFEAVKRAAPPQSLLRAVVFNVGQRHHTLKAYRYAKKVFLLKMLADMPAAFQAGNLFGGFSAIRSVFECLGDMNRAAEDLAGIKEAMDPHWMGKRIDDTIAAECASSIDWARMATASFRQYDDLSSFRAERKGRDPANDPMRGIRSLGKQVPGLLPAYEVLIEFAQPRIGTLWLVYEESKTVPDRVKTFWNRNQLGVGFPRPMIEQMRPILVQLFDVLYDCLPFMKEIDREFDRIDARMAKVTQDEVRTMLWHFPDLFDKHEDCPCGSGKRVKYCCGE